MDEFQRYIAFTKVDDEQRIVEGVATDETVDVQNAIVDYEATKRAVTDYAQWRNVREMHQPSAVGTAEKLELNDAARSLRVAARIVDDVAWKKVKAGVYKGFSVGGKVKGSRIEKLGDGGRMIQRVIDYLLTEISLVDRPANPSAVFSLVKRADDDELAKTGQHKYPWDQCIRDQMARYGSVETARRVCGAIRSKKAKKADSIDDLVKDGAGDSQEDTSDIQYEGDLETILGEIEQELKISPKRQGETDMGAQTQKPTTPPASKGTEQGDLQKTIEPKTFDTILGEQELREQFWQVFDALRSSVRSILASELDNAQKGQMLDQSVTQFVAKIKSFIPTYQPQVMEAAAGAQDLAKLIQSGELVKSAALTEAVAGLAPSADLAKISEQMTGLAGQLGKLASSEDLTKALGRIDTLSAALEAAQSTATALEERLTKLEAQPAGDGPVLRQIGAGDLHKGSLGGDEVATLEKMIDQETNPVVKEALGKRRALLLLRPSN